VVLLLPVVLLGLKVLLLLVQRVRSMQLHWPRRGAAPAGR
jgi:hypothetical protein